MKKKSNKTCRCPKYSRSQSESIRTILGAKDVDPVEFHIGMNVEREHCDIVGCNPLMHGRIALVHSRENPHYYKLLLKYIES